ncbi:MAG: recombination protein RecR [Planctomycetota bacterium]|jgi:recombination protein RecR
MAYPEPLEHLVEVLQRLPGIGRRSAERLAFHVLRDPRASELPIAIERALTDTKRCRLCRNVAESDPCEICADAERDGSSICVVEEPRHVEALERSGAFRGLYHVLMGTMNPAEGGEPEHLGLSKLVERVRSGAVHELILATDPDAEGEATATLLLEQLDTIDAGELLVTRLARGLPSGSSIEYQHRGVIEDAFEGRRRVQIGPGRRG